MNIMDGIVRDLLSTDRETYHASPMDALREYATSPEIAQALGELVNYIKGESPQKIMYFDTNLFKDGGKVQYKSVKETSTGQDIGIPIKITDNQRNGSFSDVPLRASLYAKNGGQFIKNVISKY